MSLEAKLQEWIVQETKILSVGLGKKIPDVTALQRICEGKNKKVWKYLIEHVRSKNEVQKIRRILKLKREPDRNLYASSSSYSNPSELRLKIEKANEKRNFLTNSVAHSKDDIESVLQSTQNIRDEICKTRQKTAFLHLASAKYQDKCLALNDVYSELVSLLSTKISDSQKQAKLGSDFPVIHNPRSGSFESLDEGIVGIPHLLKGIASMISNLKPNQSSQAQSARLKKSVDRLLVCVSMSDVLFDLKEISRKSFMDFTIKESLNSTPSQEEPKSFETSDSLIKHMKFKHVSSVFAAKKLQKEIQELTKEKNLLMSKELDVLCSENANNKLIVELIVKHAKGVAAKQSVKQLDTIVRSERDSVQVLKKGNMDSELPILDFKRVMSNFYAEFDLLQMLVKSVPETISYLGGYLQKLHSFAEEQLFANATSALKEYPFKMGEDLRSDLEMMWAVFKKNDTIQPIMLDPNSAEPPLPKKLLQMLSVSHFEGLQSIIRKAKFLRQFETTEPSLAFTCGDDTATKMPQEYSSMGDMLKVMQANLETCERNIALGNGVCKSTEMAMDDWWEQKAQFIADIEYKDKSLKMWLDILFVLKDF